MKMRRIFEIGEHSVWTPGLIAGGAIVDAGANHGRFSKEAIRQFPVRAIAIEANPHLAEMLRKNTPSVVECALGATNGTATFNMGENDESSSIRKPTMKGAHLTIKEAALVKVKTLTSIIEDGKLAKIACIKMDIEGTEVEVIPSVAPVARDISPQWTVEFHDAAEFGLCSKEEVDIAIHSMIAQGFSVLVRNWPARTNVLFVDRKQLKISASVWFFIKWRYQWLAFLWRKVRRL
jgi:FkbM family methyltransferase